MEFQYRAGDDERRSRSPPPPSPSHSPPVAPSTSGSGSADGHDGPAERVRKNPAVAPMQPPPPPPVGAAAAADSAEELRRQAKKAKIRERILREEAEHWELELEVRREIREQMLQLSWPALVRSAAASGLPVVPSPARIVSGNQSLSTGAAHEGYPIGNALAASPAKRKIPDGATVSTVSAATSSKKQKTTSTCMVCGISTTSGKAMQGHLNGKVHKRKATALSELPKPMIELEPETGHEVGEHVLVPSGDYISTKLTMLTNAGALNEVMQMDGYLLCEVCNVRTADRITMMCHLEGSKHISKVQKKGQASSNKPLDEVAKKGTKGTSAPEAATSAVVGADPETLVLELYGVPHTVRRLEGFLLCELCNVKVPSMNGMQYHLSGKKHKSKAKASSDASVNISTGAKEVAKAQWMDTDTAVVAGMTVQVAAPLDKSLDGNNGDDSKLQETTATSIKENVATKDSTRTCKKKVKKASVSPAAAQENNICDSDSLTMEVDSVHHPLKRMDGFLVCPCCKVKAQSESIMQSHLAGKKHKHKMTLSARVNKDASVLTAGLDEVQGNNSKKTDVEAELARLPVTQEKSSATAAPMEVDKPEEFKPDTCIGDKEDGEITLVQSNSLNSAKAIEDAESVLSLTAPQVKKDATMAPIEVDGTTEVQPAIHIESAEDGRITRVESNSSKSVKADKEAESEPQAENAARIEVDGRAEVQPSTCTEPAEDGELTQQTDQGEHAAAAANGSVSQVSESVKKDNTAVPGKLMRIQVEGKVFTVLQQENGRFSCEPCGVHGCNKNSMIQHLYTRTHWDRANFAETEKGQEAAAGVVDNDGNCCSTAGEGSGGAHATIAV